MNSVVKVCGVRTAADLEVALDAGANAIGFIFCRQSPRWIEPATVPVMPGSYLRIGVFRDPTADEVCDAVRVAKLDAVQIHGRVPSLSADIALWRAIPPASAPPLTERAQTWVLDNSNGSGITFDWELVSGFPQRFVLAGGLDGSNVGEAVRVARPWGVDACSRLESAPGVKDPARVRAFVAAAWSALKS